MNPFEEFIEKHNGHYTEEAVNGLYTVNGMYTFSPKEGFIEYKGYKIFLYIGEVRGAVPVAEPLRVRLFLNKPIPFELTIFPRTRLSKLFHKLSRGKQPIIAQGYKIKASSKLKKRIYTSQYLENSLFNYKLYIRTDKNLPGQLSLTPAHGYGNPKDIENFCEALYQVAELIRAL